MLNITTWSPARSTVWEAADGREKELPPDSPEAGKGGGQQPDPTTEGRRQAFSVHWWLQLQSASRNHTEASTVHTETDKEKSFKANYSLKDFIPAFLHSAAAG